MSARQEVDYIIQISIRRYMSPWRTKTLCSEMKTVPGTEIDMGEVPIAFIIPLGIH